MNDEQIKSLQQKLHNTRGLIVKEQLKAVRELKKIEQEKQSKLVKKP